MGVKIGGKSPTEINTEKILDNVTGDITNSTYSHVAGTTEDDFLVFTADIQDIFIEFDVSGYTVGTLTVREYVQTDGSNYRQASERVFPTDFDSNVEAIIMSHHQKNNAYKITLQKSDSTGVSVPYRYEVVSKDDST